MVSKETVILGKSEERDAGVRFAPRRSEARGPRGLPGGGKEERDSGHRQKGREAPMVVLSAPGVHWCAPCPPVPPFTRVPSQPCSPLRSPHEHVWRLRRGGQRLWFSLEEPFVPQFSAVYPKCSLLPSSAVPSPLPCDPVPCVF